MIQSADRGNEIYFNDQVKDWCYKDTTTPAIFKSRCPECKELHDKNEPDKCIGKLIGLTNACCGHGNIKDCYVQFLDGSMIFGEDAKLIQEILKRNPQ